MSLVPVATLSTLSRKHPGFPFGSMMPFALDSAGRPEDWHYWVAQGYCF